MELRNGVHIPKDHILKKSELNKIKRKPRKSCLTAKQVIYNNLIKISTIIKYSVSILLCFFLFFYYMTNSFKQ